MSTVAVRRMFLILILVTSVLSVRLSDFPYLCSEKCFIQRANREFKIQKWKNCRENALGYLNISFAKTNINKVTFSVAVELSENIDGDLVLIFEVNRCSLDMKTCQFYNRRNFYQLCDLMNGESFFGLENLFKSVKPQPVCHPVRSNTYVSPEATIDLSVLSYLPLDGFVWLFSINVVEKATEGKLKKNIGCASFEVKVVRTRKNETKK